MATTSLDKKISRLEEEIKLANAEMKKAKATKAAQERKDRNTYLIAFGIMLESKYKTLSHFEREKIRAWVNLLDERNKKRVLAGFDAIEKNKKEDKNTASNNIAESTAPKKSTNIAEKLI